ncbi:hypothetical protein ACT7DL_11990 [Bacillus paranthracis]
MIKTNEIKQKDALLEEITDYVLNKRGNKCRSIRYCSLRIT